jgi:hypothetical protein
MTPPHVPVRRMVAMHGGVAMPDMVPMPTGMMPHQCPA